MLLALVTAGCGKSGYSNCVQVQTEADFNGEWLKTSRTLSQHTVRTEDCEALDRAQDGGNGPRIGKVRWAECPFGPDCGEAGEF